MHYSVVSSLIILTIALTPFRLHAADGGALKTIVWERYFGQDNYNYTNKAGSSAEFMGRFKGMGA